MAAAVSLRSDLDGAALRKLARASRDAKHVFIVRVTLGRQVEFGLADVRQLLMPDLAPGDVGVMNNLLIVHGEQNAPR